MVVVEFFPCGAFFKDGIEDPYQLSDALSAVELGECRFNYALYSAFILFGIEFVRGFCVVFA